MWNTMIKGYSHNSSPEAAVSLYIEMLARGVGPDNYTYPFLLKAFNQEMAMEFGDELHAHVTKFGFCANPHVQDALIHVYSMGGEMDAARELFERSPKQNSVLWNAMISAYNRSKEYEESCKLFAEMEELEVEPTLVTLVLVISACAKLKNLEYGAWIHRNIENFGIEPNLALQNALIDMYAGCGDIRTACSIFENMGTKDVISWTAMVAGFANVGQVDHARELFERMPERDIISWTAMIDGYIKANRFKEVLEIFRAMQAASVRPDEFTMVSVLTACANLGALELGEWARVYMEHHKINMDVFVNNAMIDLYCKCGCVEKALEIFEKMQKKDKITWTAMITGLAVNGQGEQALDLFTRMLSTSIRPDDVTYIGALIACIHAGLVDEGREIFSGMINTHGVLPNVSHYGCLVDLLGRAGQLKEALETITNMPMKPNSRVWGALLGACRVYKNLEMGELAANKILELEPDNGAAYVLLWNLYAKCNRWEDVARVKDMAMHRGVKKIPGCSLIEINGEMHEFVAGDRAHPRIEEIHTKLEEMGRDLVLAGYVSDIKEVSFDICEEEKEDTVYRHSEKLAIAFGLLSSPAGATIRVVKNLRICLDCHNAIKLISSVYRRLIVVRDKTRFHHFSGERCSCKDYW
ncbi:putative pentatricopeptide repeat-containing protein At3g15930 [Phalaenopsis equestris]|uniref:putative pentatricopeptide repeat-containing protein At3g15930 n=1 Tax=Phalaenopsis equestris TaxID=78828 RepID=UPI0009E2D3EF|nr:putative pentatricopeptide repeat-containing protein At3g15930 [Phalaenopsis equestris]